MRCLRLTRLQSLALWRGNPALGRSKVVFLMECEHEGPGVSVERIWRMPTSGDLSLMVAVRQTHQACPPFVNIIFLN